MVSGAAKAAPFQSIGCGDLWYPTLATKISRKDGALEFCAMGAGTKCRSFGSAEKRFAQDEKSIIRVCSRRD